MQPTDYLTCLQAAKLAPGNPPPTSVYRWMMDGIGIRRNKSAPRVKLEHIRVGGKLFTTQAWLLEFFKACADANAIEKPPKVKPPGPRTMSSRQRQRRVAEAMAECG